MSSGLECTPERWVWKELWTLGRPPLYIVPACSRLPLDVICHTCKSINFRDRSPHLPGVPLGDLDTNHVYIYVVSGPSPSKSAGFDHYKSIAFSLQIQNSNSPMVLLAPCEPAALLEQKLRVVEKKTPWSKNCQEMIQCCGIKSITQTYIFKPQARGIPVMYNWWWRTRAQAVSWTAVRRGPNIPTSYYWCPIFSRLALVRGQPQTACSGIRRYCPCHSDALRGPGGHVSVNIHYQNP